MRRKVFQGRRRKRSKILGQRRRRRTTEKDKEENIIENEKEENIIQKALTVAVQKGGRTSMKMLPKAVQGRIKFLAIVKGRIFFSVTTSLSIH